MVSGQLDGKLTPERPGIAAAMPAKVSRAPRPLRVCIVTREFFGPFKNGGIGTAYTNLAHFLAALGHEVTVYFSFAPERERSDLEHWIRYYEAYGIRFIAGDEPDPPSTGGVNSDSVKVTRQVYEWLKQQDFDVVHCSEYRGDAYFSLRAKELGLAFQDTTFVIKTSAPTLWCNLGNDTAVTDVLATLTMYIERKSVELADYVISPSQHMLGWMAEFNYDLPERSYVHQNLIVPDKDHPLGPYPARSRDGEVRPVREIVYFGRLEWRKGLVIFCRALRVLQRRGLLEGTKVTLLGKGIKTTYDYIAEQSRDWNFTWQVIDDYDSEQAIAYLSEGDRLACIPSLIENSAFTIYESLLHGIPFIASDTGGNAELVHPDDRPTVIFDRESPSALVDRLAEVLEDGVPVARPSFDFEANRDEWRRFHDFLADGAGRPRPAKARKRRSRRALPKVSICMAHYNRPVELAQALDSVRSLTYPRFDVSLTDDGSEDPEAIAYLDSLEPEFDERGWRILRQENRYLGAARNTSARHATGDYLLFMDDDNLAKPHELDVFVQVAQHTDADILTCFADTFPDGDPRTGDVRILRETPIGDCLASGIVKNVFGDANALIKREVFEALGGFTEDYGTGTQDYELFLAAVFRGYRLLVIPEALFWYRSGHTRMNSETDTMEKGRLRAFRSVMDQVPRELHLPLRLAQGSAMELIRLRSDHNRLLGHTRGLQREFDLLQRLFDGDGRG